MEKMRRSQKAYISAVGMALVLAGCQSKGAESTKVEAQTKSCKEWTLLPEESGNTRQIVLLGSSVVATKAVVLTWSQSDLDTVYTQVARYDSKTKAVSIPTGNVMGSLDAVSSQATFTDKNVALNFTYQSSGSTGLPKVDVESCTTYATQ